MERKQYLELCQKVATLPGGILGVKGFVPNDLRVVYDGVIYYPLEYCLGFDKNGKSIHRAVLHDLKANSVMDCPLEEVKENESL